MRKSTAASKEDNNANAQTGHNGRQQQQQSGSYSSIVGSLQSQNGTETRTARGDNPFKYGKDEMMQVYSSMVANGDKVSHAPLDFERYDQVASSKPVVPASMNEPTEDEKVLLAGNINSEQKPRRAEQTEVRQNGRRDNRQNGGARETKKHEYRKVADDQQATRHVQSSANANGRTSTETGETTGALDTGVEPTREIGQDAPRSQISGRNTSRLATMGVFDTASDSNTSSKWKDEKDEDVLKEAMGYADASNQEIEKLTDMYQNQSISSVNPQQTHQTRSYAEQQYKPLTNGLPDLFPKAATSASFAQNQQGPPRGGFLESTPSPGLPVRQDPPMTRVMVMPDKLKWQYRDPTGQNQGPFSGLEMHDWYKAGFFQPNLLVKREEDEDFEPLSILVRRIGNQREPFLVPLPSRVSITAPARSGSQDGKESWPNGQNWSGGGQPPFPQSFPSFGTTLTAEQQNALERRKQEEQYLMHRQREFLQQQQMAQQMAAQRLLHHQHPYGHNGQSFGYGMDRRGSPFSSGSERQGSMSSFDMGANGGAVGGSGWGGYAPQNQNAQRGPYTDFGAGIFDTPKSEVAEQTFREPERLVEHAREDFNTSTQGQEQSMTAKYQNTKQIDYATRMAQQAQAMQLQAEAAKKEALIAKEKHDNTRSSAQSDQSVFQQDSVTQQQASSILQESKLKAQAEVTSEQAQESDAIAPESPAAVYTVPWAAVSTKGRSLKEIQDIEAKRAAAQRQAERQAALEAQAQAQAQADNNASQATSVTIPPLNWASESNNDAPITPGAAWKSSGTTPGKKTLAQIQEEEELARKARAANQARVASQTSSNQTSISTMGTRYADSAMKTASPSWSTVGAGGRVSTPSTNRTTEQKLPSIVQSPATIKARAPVASTQPLTTRPVDPDAISPDFLNWARSALKGLNPGVNFAEFLQLLLSFGTDGGKDTREIISDSIYANSATLDGRRFADEFCKRRKEDLKNPHGQNKSISELTSTLASASGSSNGWSDVVKTKPIKQDLEEEWNTSFKLQTKKGGKRK